MLTISKPLSAGQAQNYHQKEFTAKEQNYWSQRGVIAGEWQGQLAGKFGLAGAVTAEDFARLSQGQHPATPASNLFASVRPTSTKIPMARPSRRWSIAPGGMRRFPHPNLSRSPLSWVAMTAFARPIETASRSHLSSLNTTRRHASAETIRRKPRPSSSPRSSSMTRPARSMVMLRRSFIPMPSSSISPSAITARLAQSSRRAFSRRSNLPRLFINRS